MKRTFFLFLTIFLLASCKKNSSSSCTLSASALVGSYKITAYTTQQSASSGVYDDYAAYPACAKDDLVTLNANGTYQKADAGTKCTPPEPTITGTWSLSGSVFTNDGTPTTVTNFDCNGFTIATNGYPKETTVLVRQ